MPSRRDRKVIRTRNYIIGGVVAVVILVLGYGTLYSTGVTGGEFQEGTHYDLIENARGHRPGTPYIVREFFSYACVHCRNFDPVIEQWRAALPDDVELRRSPVAFSPLWSLLARTYFALDELDALGPNHDRLFSAIHDRGQQFLSAEMIADFVDGHGVSRAEFLAEFESPAVNGRMRQAERDQREMGIASVPTLVVDDKYRIGMDVGRRTSLDVVDYVIDLERRGGVPEGG